jgi:hypothetical protein
MAPKIEIQRGSDFSEVLCTISNLETSYRGTPREAYITILYRNWPQQGNAYSKAYGNVTIPNGVSSYSFWISDPVLGPGSAISLRCHLTYSGGSQTLPQSNSVTSYTTGSFNLNTYTYNGAAAIDIQMFEMNQYAEVHLYNGWSYSDAFIYGYGEAQHGNNFTHSVYGKAFNSPYTVTVYQNSASIGTKTITTPAAPNPRPAQWSWNITMTTGQNFNMTAQRWNEFKNHINEIRRWKKMSDYYIEQVTKGNRANAYQYNQAAAAINNIIENYGGGRYLTAVATGQNITPAQFNALSNRINQIN